MVTLDGVAELALELPEVTEGEQHRGRTWAVNEKVFAWERPFSNKEAVLAEHPDAFFTIPHFDGYPAVLIQLRKITKRALRAALLDGWLAKAPPRLVEDHLPRTKTRRR